MSHPIICFEGPSGIGKTTMCNHLSDSFNIIPEVNLLFARSENEPKYWYQERQIDRYNLCQLSDKTSILDGDIFQPIWYNWVCNYPTVFLPKKETHEFYRTKLREGKISFPDLFIIFTAAKSELISRKENDQTRQRRNFEKHLKIIEPLKRYYKFLEKETELDILFISYDDIRSTKEKVLNAIKNIKKKNINGLKVLEQIENWFDQ